jgi:hypothetical protein
LEGTGGVSGKVLICPIGAQQLIGKQTFPLGPGLAGTGLVTGTIGLKGALRREEDIGIGKAFVEIGLIGSRSWTILPDDGLPNAFRITGYTNATLELGMGRFRRVFRYENRIGHSFDL